MLSYMPEGRQALAKDYDSNSATKSHQDSQQGKGRMRPGLQADTEWVCMSIR